MGEDSLRAWDVNLRNETKEQRIDRILKALDSENPEDRLLATIDLYEMGGPRALEGLCRAVRDEDWGVRVQAFEGLQRIGDKQILGTLNEVLDEVLDAEDYMFLFEVFWVLEKIGGPESVEVMSKALEDEHTEVQGETIKSLAKMGKDGVKHLVNVIQSDNFHWDVRNYAAEFLEKADDSNRDTMLKEFEKAYRMQKLDQAKSYENAFNFQKASELYDELGMEDKAKKMRKQLHQSTIIQQQLIAKKIDMSTTTEIKDSVVQRSQIGTESKAFSICPYCGEELNLPKTPNFCPYCREALKKQRAMKKKKEKDSSRHTKSTTQEEESPSESDREIEEAEPVED